MNVLREVNAMSNIFMEFLGSELEKCKDFSRIFQ